MPDEPNTFLINNYGEMFDEITASSLVKMDMDGNVLSPGGKFNNAGFIIHSGVYKARPDAMCVLHTHTRAGAGVSLIDKGLRPISQDALGIYRRRRLPRIRRARFGRGVRGAWPTCAGGTLRHPAEPRPVDARPHHPRHVLSPLHP